MKKIFKLNLVVFVTVFFTNYANACTGFGAITDTGTIIGKNRDYYYVPQQFSMLKPIQKFNHWYENTYNHQNQFYAVSSAESVSVGVNQNGLTAIEEDVLSENHPQNAQEYKMQQQRAGTPDGLVLYGVLQNFNTIDEMLPYLSKIFSVAAPDFYQFADAKKILIVEVANTQKNTESPHQFTYQILSKGSSYFTHTNTYLNAEFTPLNKAIANTASLKSSENRLNAITDLVSHAPEKNVDVASTWFLNTKAGSPNQNNANECLNLSLFRSDLQGLKSIDMRNPNEKIFGTVASMIVGNNGKFKNSSIYVMMLDSITTQNNGKQLVKYHELNTTLDKLFSKTEPKFVEREFMRNQPTNGVCS